ncbi:MAG: hypothetical protein KatS3mg031_0677 [Chitinophagales bacterium]|nr:MAG: hypothetical protein KatS3mg031_0677 [Chitinophagales bacterium]
MKQLFYAILILLSVCCRVSAQGQTSGQICFESPTNPDNVSARIEWVIQTSVDTNTQTVKIKTILSRNFTDNTYGSNAIGWPGGHSFNQLVGSDHLRLSLLDGNGVKKLEFKLDYISASSSAPSGYKSLGVWGGDGGMIYGNASAVKSVTTSLSENFNTYGYVLTSNSPVTNSNYDPDPAYPNWIFDVWYEVTVDLNAFGAAGFGTPVITGVHASPSKTGNHSEPVEPVSCPDPLELQVIGNCTQDCSESIRLTVHHPFPPFAYAWSNGETTKDISGLCAGTYTVTVITSNADTLIGSAVVADTTCPAGKLCFSSPLIPDIVNAFSEWTYNPDQTVTIRTTLAKTFVDNTYGTNTIGWSGNHFFHHLVSSDKLQLALYDANGSKKLEFKMDYISASSSAPSGYKSLGVWGGDGGIIYGNASAVKSVTTSLSENFNTYGYVLTTNSPVTNSYYDPDPAYPNWIFDVWYEVTVDLHAFGPAGFGYPQISEIHASPSKTGNNSEIVVPGNCPYNCDSTFIALTASLKPNDGCDSLPESCNCPCDGKMRSLTVQYLGSSGVNIHVYADKKKKKLITTFTNVQHGQILTVSAASLKGGTFESNTYFVSDGGTVTKIHTSCSQFIAGLTFGDFKVLGYTDGQYQSCDASNGCTSPCDCEGKMRNLTVRYHGPSGVTIHVYKKSSSSAGNIIVTFNNVQQGDLLYIDASTIGGQFESNTYFQIAGSSGFTAIHTSCSQYILGLTFGYFEVLGYTDGQYNSCSLLKCNGSIALQVNGGQPPYTYEWSNGEDTQNLNNLCSGNYTVTVTDANGCSATGGFTIQDIPCASAVIGDYVWNDTNANGVQDSSETGIPAIKVTLIDAGTQAVVASTFTDSLGFYLFDGLPPGSYYLIFDHTTAPANFVPTYVNAGDDDKDSDADQVTGQTSIYTLSAGDSVLTVDAGYYALACLGDMVWNDLNQNNRQDPGEPGIADVKVTLYDALTLDLVGTQWTDSSGHYLFCLLPPGSYYLVFDHASVPAGLSPVQSHVGDDSTDSNADEITGQTSVYVLAPGEINTTADAGYTCAHIPAAIQGDLVILPGDSVIYSGPSGVQSYSWFVQGSARISGPADQQTVTVVALDSCDSFILTLQTAIGNCNGSTSLMVMVEDTEPPMIDFPPAEDAFSCDEAIIFPSPLVADNSGLSLIVHVDGDDTLVGNCPNAYTIIRTFSVYDLCGNSSSATFSVSVVDTAAPVITGIGPDKSITCEEAVEFDQATAQDGCGGQVQLTYEDDTIAGQCANAYIIIRTWTATDACGNSSSATQAITVTDDTPPVITGIGPDKSITCEEAVEFDQATAQDGCGGQVQLAYEDDTIAGQCANAYIIIRTWTATDACGNSSSATQAITVTDDTPPVITGVGADETISCPAIPQFSTPLASDNCGQATLSYTDDIEFGTCSNSFTITRTWTATDACGNSSSATQAITVTDDTPPVITGIGPDKSITCEEVVEFDQATAQDGCGGQVQLAYEDDTIAGQCANAYIIIRTWTATDACGNSSSATQAITVTDDTPPVITGIGPDKSITCEEAVEFDQATAQDGCGGQVQLTYEDDTIAGQCANAYIIIRTWTATDACGNSSSATQAITVTDDTPPVITGVGADETISCPAIPQFRHPLPVTTVVRQP